MQCRRRRRRRDDPLPDANATILEDEEEEAADTSAADTAAAKAKAEKDAAAKAAKVKAAAAAKAAKDAKDAAAAKAAKESKAAATATAAAKTSAALAPVPAPVPDATSVAIASAEGAAAAAAVQSAALGAQAVAGAGAGAEAQWHMIGDECGLIRDGGYRENMFQWFKDIDANHNGVMSRHEMKAGFQLPHVFSALSGMVQKADVNNDGIVTEDELWPYLDADSSGKVTISEYIRGVGKLVKARQTNGRVSAVNLLTGGAAAGLDGVMPAPAYAVNAGNPYSTLNSALGALHFNSAEAAARLEERRILTIKLQQERFQLEQQLRLFNDLVQTQSQINMQGGARTLSRSGTARSGQSTPTASLSRASSQRSSNAAVIAAAAIAAATAKKAKKDKKKAAARTMRRKASSSTPVTVGSVGHLVSPSGRLAKPPKNVGTLLGRSFGPQPVAKEVAMSDPRKERLRKLKNKIRAGTEASSMQQASGATEVKEDGRAGMYVTFGGPVNSTGRDVIAETEA